MPTRTLKISLPKHIWQIINQDLIWLGNSESERIKNILISSILLKNHNTSFSDKTEIQQIKENINVIEDVISTIIDLHIMSETTECIKNEISR